MSMKTYDYHNLLHDLLPITVRNGLNHQLQSIVYRLGELFRWICCKEIKISKILGMKTMYQYHLDGCTFRMVHERSQELG